jgi:hypothetical protein
VVWRKFCGCWMAWAWGRTEPKSRRAGESGGHDRRNASHTEPSPRQSSEKDLPRIELMPPIRKNQIRNHEEGRCAGSPDESCRVILGCVRCSHGTITRPSDFVLMGKSMLGSYKERLQFERGIGGERGEYRH